MRGLSYFGDPVSTESSVVSWRIKRMGFILPQEEMGKEKLDDMRKREVFTQKKVEIF